MSIALSQENLLALLLGSIRALAWISICPPFNGRGLSSQAKVLFSVGITLPIFPRLAETVPSTVSSPALTAHIIEQILIGAALGFCTRLLFAAVESAGSLIDLFGGFSVAFSFDPYAYSGNAVFGRFYNLLTGVLLFTTNAHHMILAGFTRSYHALPLTGTLPLERLQRFLTIGIGDMFLAALQISGPLIAVLFLTDLALGLLSRVAPSLNAFGLGFPAKILLTLVLAGTAILVLPEAVRTLTQKAVTVVMEIVGA